MTLALCGIKGCESQSGHEASTEYGTILLCCEHSDPNHAVHRQVRQPNFQRGSEAGCYS